MRDKPVLGQNIELKDNAMLKVKPELFDEWDFEKNDELGLDVYEVVATRTMRVWWICSKCNSSWDIGIRRRALEGNNCPYCAGKRVNDTNSLACKYPKIAKEWHPHLNNSLTPSLVTSGYTQKVWWLCPDCCSDYDASPRNRIKNNGCPYCGWRKVNHTNSLEATHPSILINWDYKKNIKISPQTIKAGSDVIAHWICNICKSEYKRKIHSETIAQNCPYCAGRKINHTNSLASLNPDLASEWHPVLNGKLHPNKITCNSGTKVWWFGKCGHEWQATVTARHNGTSCPYCANQKLLVGFNDMWTTNPKLASKLANHEDGYKYTQNSNKRVDWKCPECSAEIKNRVISSIERCGLSCPSCSDGVSFPEKFVYNALREANIDFEYQKIFSWSQGKRYDFYMKDYGCIIEVHGLQHYVNSPFNNLNSGLEQVKTNDSIKITLAESNEIKNYVIIDARESTRAFIQNSLMESPIAFVFQDTDFSVVYQKSLNSFVYEICSLWNEGVRPITAICEATKLGQGTVRKYLHMGENIGIVNYREEARIEKNKKISKSSTRKVIQLTLEFEFIKQWESINEAAKYYGTHHPNIVRCCQNKCESARGFKWIYAEDYYKEAN